MVQIRICGAEDLFSTVAVLPSRKVHPFGRRQTGLDAMDEGTEHAQANCVSYIPVAQVEGSPEL